MKDNNKTPKEHNPFNVFPDDVSVEDMKPLDMSVIAKQIADAYNKALLQKIEANTIIINEKYAKVKNTVCPGPFGGEWNIPPMLCGLRVKFDDLPEQFAFALTKFPINTEQELKEEVRKQTAKEILKELLFSVENCKKKDILWYIESISKRYGIELFGKTEQVGNPDKLEDEV